MKVFKETQRFTQTWLMVLMGVSSLVPIVIVFREYLKENSTVALNELIWVSLIVVFFSSIIFLFRLDTRVDEQGIHYKFIPLHRKKRMIPWNEIYSAEIRNYDPITEYGGWGIKAGFKRKYGKAINVSGTIGLQLVLTDTKKVLIGTQKKDEMERVIASYKHKFEQHD